MDRKIHLEPGAGGTRITQYLRDLYAAPADAAYWEGLESRIMSRIAQSADVLQRGPASWWSVLERWTLPGLAAAGVLFALAGMAWSRENAAELGTAYEVFSEPADADMLPGAVNVVTAQRDQSAQREAIFRYVISH